MLHLNPHVKMTKHPTTKFKVYVPYISGKRLGVFWKTKTKAKLYAEAVLARYYKKLKIHAVYLKMEELKAKELKVEEAENGLEQRTD